MMPSSPIHTATTLAILAGSQPAATKLASVPWIGPSSAPQIPSCNVPIARSPRCHHPRFAANRPRQPLLSSLFKPSPVAKSP